MSNLKIKNLTKEHTVIEIERKDVLLISKMLEKLEVFVNNKLDKTLTLREKEISHILANTLNAARIMLGQCDGACSKCTCDVCTHHGGCGGHLFGDKTILDVPDEFIDNPDGYIDSIEETK